MLRTGRQTEAQSDFGSFTQTEHPVVVTQAPNFRGIDWFLERVSALIRLELSFSRRKNR